jgi:hypothetical protein
MTGGRARAPRWRAAVGGRTALIADLFKKIMRFAPSQSHIMAPCLFACQPSPANTAFRCAVAARSPRLSFFFDSVPMLE